MSTSTPTTEPTKVPRLPPELWLLIFRFATSAPIISPFEFAYYYEPFQSRHRRISTALFDAALRDKCAISSVCRQWHALARDTLYEDIRIGPHIAGLYAILIEPAPVSATIVGGESGTGTITARHCVRRAVLPYAQTEKPTYYWHAPSALALLALLPHLEVLVRPPLPVPAPTRKQGPLPIPIPTATPTAVPTLPALRRLEWAFKDDGGEPGKGRISFFHDILNAAPSLHELILTGQIPFFAGTALRQKHLHLRELRTLRLHDGAGTCPYIAEQTTYWELPVLEKIVVEGLARAQPLKALCRKFGGQVRVLELELGGGGWGGMSMGDVSKTVAFCPALEELNLRVVVEDNLDRIPMDIDDMTWSVQDIHDVSWTCTHHTLQRIRIRVDLEEWSVETWMQIVEYVGKFGKGCSVLSEVVLYVLPEQVEATLQNPQFLELRETLLSSGKQLLLHLVHA